MSQDPNKNKPANPEPGEPSVDSGKTPVWLFAGIAILLYWGMNYLDLHGGGFTPAVYEPYSSTALVKRLQPKKGGDDSYAKGQLLFEGTCKACHQSTGLGTPGQYPPLAGSEWVQAQNPNRLIRIVLHGAAGPLSVSGHEFVGAMPAWKDVFTDEQIANVLTYVRQSWGNNAPKVDVAKVKALREKEKARATPWSAEELLQIPDTE